MKLGWFITSIYGFFIFMASFVVRQVGFDAAGKIIFFIGFMVFLVGFIMHGVAVHRHFNDKSKINK